MSRIGKKTIIIPQGVTVTLSDDILLIKGPRGEEKFTIPKGIKVLIENNKIRIQPIKEDKNIKALWGTTRALINNIINGLTMGFSKQLVLDGVGYRISIEGKKLVLKVVFINTIDLDIPEDLNLSIDKNILTISGNSKEKVGQFAAKVRAVKPVEPYKGKGFHYIDEHVRRKAGKKLATASG
jgi:large subunit ribosomal protein L6